MIEKVNPSHPDKLADRIAGAMVDLAYKKQENPKIAVEVLIGHGDCHIIAETSVHFEGREICEIVSRIAGEMFIDYREVPQDDAAALLFVPVLRFPRPEKVRKQPDPPDPLRNDRLGQQLNGQNGGQDIAQFRHDRKSPFACSSDSLPAVFASIPGNFCFRGASSAHICLLLLKQTTG